MCTWILLGLVSFGSSWFVPLMSHLGAKCCRFLIFWQCSTAECLFHPSCIACLAVTGIALLHGLTLKSGLIQSGFVKTSVSISSLLITLSAASQYVWPYSHPPLFAFHHNQGWTIWIVLPLRSALDFCLLPFPPRIHHWCCQQGEIGGNRLYGSRLLLQADLSHSLSPLSPSSTEKISEVQYDVTLSPIDISSTVITFFFLCL